MKKSEPIFVVQAQRWGDNNTHAYIVGASSRLESAKEIAKKEAEYRGGKYAGVVYKCPNGKWEHGHVTEVWRAKSMAD